MIDVGIDIEEPIIVKEAGSFPVLVKVRTVTQKHEANGVGFPIIGLFLEVCPLR